MAAAGTDIDDTDGKIVYTGSWFQQTEEPEVYNQ